MHLSGGNCHDAPQGRISIENIGDSYSGIPYLMDRAYEGDKTRELCQSFGHKPVVPPKKNRINPWEYDHELYKRRNIIERLFRWLKAFRRVCTRYDKLDVIFLSFVQIACVFMWLKQCQQALSEKELLVEMNLELKRISEKCDEIGRKIVICME